MKNKTVKRDSTKSFTPNGGKPVATIKSTPVKRQTVVTLSGEVPASKIDSIRKANPRLGAKIGTGYKDTGGKTRFGDDSSDMIKAALKGKGK